MRKQEFCSNFQGPSQVPGLDLKNPVNPTPLHVGYRPPSDAYLYLHVDRHQCNAKFSSQNRCFVPWPGENECQISCEQALEHTWKQNNNNVDIHVHIDFSFLKC